MYGTLLRCAAARPWEGAGDSAGNSYFRQNLLSWVTHTGCVGHLPGSLLYSGPFPSPEEAPPVQEWGLQSAGRVVWGVIGGHGLPRKSSAQGTCTPSWTALCQSCGEWRWGRLCCNSPDLGWREALAGYAPQSWARSD